MSVGEWLRFAQLSLLAGWLAVLYLRLASRPVPQAPGRTFPAGRQGGWATSTVLGAVAALAAAQVMVEISAASDPLTPLGDVVSAVLASPYGGLSLALLVAAVVLAALAWRSRRLPGAVLWGSGLVLLLGCGASALTSGAAVDAASSSGDIVMSPTLTVPRSTVTQKDPSAGDPTSAARGKIVYQQNCQVCHGIDGDGRGPAAANMRIRPASFHNPQHFQSATMDGPHFWVIQHGDGEPSGMPAWGGKLTDQQIWDVLNYVKVLSGSSGVPNLPG